MDYQHITILGRATAEPKQLQGKNSKEYASFSVAVNRYLGKDRGHVTTYYDCLLFDKHAKEKSVDKIKKGALIAIQGRPEADAYVAKDGQAKGQMKIVVNSWRVLK